MKRILEKYEEARKARAKDAKKMEDLKHSVSNRRNSFPVGHVFPDTPVMEENQRPGWHFFYTPLGTASTETLELVRILLVREFGTIDFKPSTHFESPFEFRMTLRQKLKDNTGDEDVIDHLIQVYLRRDPKVQRNMVYFKLLKTDSKLAWIKIWKKMFALFHVYGIADDKNMADLLQSQALRLGPNHSVPRDEFGRLVKVVPRLEGEESDEAKSPDVAEAGGEGELREVKTAAPSAGPAACAGALLCGAGAADLVE